MSPEQHFVGRFLNFVRSKARYAAVGCVAGLAAGIVYLHIASATYTAILVVGPTSAVPAQAGLGNLSSLSLGSLGGLGAKISSFVGGNSGSAVAPFDAFQQSLTSNELAERLLHRSDLMHRIFYHEWNEDTKQWQEPPGIVPTLKAAVRYVLGLPKWHAPDAFSVQRFLSDKLAKTPQPGSSMIELSFEFKDPTVAREFLQAVYDDSDQIVRRIDLDRSTKIIESINRDLASSTTLSASAKQYLIQFLDQEYQVKALAKADAAYAADIFDSISVSPRPTSPVPVPALVLGAFLGIIGGLLYPQSLLRRKSLAKPGAPSSTAGAIGA
jgi:hypothetical protein